MLRTDYGLIQAFAPIALSNTISRLLAEGRLVYGPDVATALVERTVARVCEAPWLDANGRDTITSPADMRRALSELDLEGRFNRKADRRLARLVQP